MIRLTLTQRILYGMFAQVVVLLLIYAGLAMLTAVKFLPDDPLALSLTYAQTSGFANLMLDYAILTGLLSAGLYVSAVHDGTHTLAKETLLLWGYRGWTILLMLLVLAGMFSQFDGRHLLETPLILDIVTLILMGVFALAGVRWQSPFLLVWAVGMGLVAVCILAGIVPAGDFLQDRILRVVAVHFKYQVAYVLCGVGIGFWLMTRWSNVHPDWAKEGVFTVGGIVTLAGALVSIAPLYPLGLPAWFDITPIFIVPMCYAIFAGHQYRALRDRNTNATLSANWYAIGVLLLMAGIGFLGAVLAVPGVIQWAQGTKLTEVQFGLVALGIVAIILGFINNACAEIRGENRRITGYVPLWLVTFGTVIGAMVLGSAGVAQVYLERVLSVGYLDVQRLLVPMYSVWIVCVLAVALGIGIYALGFRARRPHGTVE